ncbi:MAG: putative ATPase (AAA+ superfamily) [Parcubacteria group bacterium Gr01-1014_18]|nr:MAG: putative ATPase (AAA+ superfamily) [Parcubacteria group bacterium Greene0416_36]TSC79869.1 MAG: putative ATPase (AAA+ superfamily) [Parcubacteria group bacterium Gr01-1014_18]TSC98301.1 MAG: putative ATPase (AAA+ superfamily) [Parcubacteria group bacterium Greene1014_20]TSD06658.1 MAG: putative ATPase (AAA+ superfamily) [Parcubacteria group bacterium Greene0714_2]
MYKRLIFEEIKNKLWSGKVIILAGPRQCGKTTLILDLLHSLEPVVKTKVFNCDNPIDRELLSGHDLDFLKQQLGDAKIIAIDEGQKIEAIGQTLKLLVDHYGKEKQFIVTGSSSINLLSAAGEALTGRKWTYFLYPLSAEELFLDSPGLELLKNRESLLIYGQYPEVAKQTSFESKQQVLKELASSYLYQDVLEYENVKNSDKILALLKALALQIGSEVSYLELSRLLEVSKLTVEKYVDLLEKSFVIFKLSPFTQNKRRELSRMKKIYFYDLGIRNAILNNFNLMPNRSDAGALWENFMVAERMKYRAYHHIYANSYFWRTYDGAEVDLVEERDGKLLGYEFKWDEMRKVRPPKTWLEYPEASFDVIGMKEWKGFIWP